MENREIVVHVLMKEAKELLCGGEDREVAAVLIQAAIDVLAGLPVN